MPAYYNEHDRFAAAWLRELITAGLIAPGDVDERPIQEVQADDVRSYTQCHFFAGIGGWSYALRLAGWPDDRPVWTGSCPCQPFSTSGKHHGFNDPRHLWPVWFPLIRECRPSVVFGEQVATALSWYDLVSGNMEAENYACGATIIGAHSVGAPHMRQRLYWVADTQRRTSERHGYDMAGSPSRIEGSTQERQRLWDDPRDGDTTHPLGEPNGTGLAERQSERRGLPTPLEPQAGQAPLLAGVWTATDWLPCRDGKSRPVEPHTFPLAHGVPTRMGRLRGYGNAIVPQVAAVFIQAYCETQAD